ncbi:MAG: PD-(D/E)XK nuclease-like domain-containing protein [Smithella sp.]
MGKEKRVNMRSGIYKIPFSDYLADPCIVPSLSRSTIKSLVNECPRKAYHGHPRLNPDHEKDEKTQFDIGTAAHDCFLGGENAVMVFDYKDWKKKKAQEAKAAARSFNKTPLLREQFDAVQAMVAVAHESLATFEAYGEPLNLHIADGESELTYIWEEKETWFRIRPDWISKDKKIILDYKTTGQSADPENYISIIDHTGLDIQDALYRRGVHAIDDTDPDFWLMVQETEAPYLCSFINLDMQFKDMGEQKVNMGIRVWRKCLKTGIWPAYPTQLCTVEPKPWSLASWEMKKSNILVGGESGIHN